MTTTKRNRLRSAVAGIAIAIMCPVVSAGEVTTFEWDHDYNDFLNERLAESFEHHVEPAIQWYLASIAGVPVNRNSFREFSRQFLTATYAEFVYTYNLHGIEHSRTYFSSSGEVQPRLPGGNGLRSYLDFVPGSPTDVHSVLLSTNRSTISHIPLDDGRPENARRNDAELKAVRSIERDIQSGVVPRGGEVTAFVSQRMCDSCARAVQLFADLYDVSVHVNTPTNNDGWASFRFMRKRKNFIEAARASLPTRFNDRPPGPPSDGPPPPPSCGAIAIH
jgi:hypothetical protein